MPVQAIASKTAFDEAVASEKLTLVDFFATWCGPCKMIAPTLEKFSNDYTDIQVIKVDVDELEDVAQAAQVSAMPTFKFYKAGKVVDELVGANPNALEEKIKANK